MAFVKTGAPEKQKPVFDEEPVLEDVFEEDEEMGEEDDPEEADSG